MPERNLKYLNKSDFGGMRSRRGKRKPNQLFVYHTAIQCFDFPKGPHFNKLPVQLILEIFKYLWAYELLRKVSLVCKYWYNLCRDRALWTSITWIGTPRTLGYLLQLTRYQVHELVLTHNLFTFSDKALALPLKKCTHLKCLKLPKNACRELFKRELPRTNIIEGISYASYLLFHDEMNLPGDDEMNLPGDDEMNLPGDGDTSMARLSDTSMARLSDTSMARLSDSSIVRPTSFSRSLYCVDSSIVRPTNSSIVRPTSGYSYFGFGCLFCCDDSSIVRPTSFPPSFHCVDSSIVRPTSRYSYFDDKNSELKSLQRHHNSRSVRVDDKIMKTPDRPCIQKFPLQHQPVKIKPRPPKGRNNHHKKVKRFRGLRKRFKMFSLT